MVSNSHITRFKLITHETKLVSIKHLTRGNVLPIASDDVLLAYAYVVYLT